jgi:hypothetical protein
VVGDVLEILRSSDIIFVRVAYNGDDLSEESRRALAVLNEA